jgi:hypothetical protein
MENHSRTLFGTIATISADNPASCVLGDLRRVHPPLNYAGSTHTGASEVYCFMQYYIIMLWLHLSVCVCVCTSGRLPEAIGPELKTSGHRCTWMLQQAIQ